MIRTLLSILIAMCISCGSPTQTAQAPTQERPEFALVIHGGAGAMKRSLMSGEAEKNYRAGLQEALDTGKSVLKKGGSAADAVEATINVLEENPLFNSGKGAVFTHDETIELDASFMNGEHRNAGAVAGVKTVRHPISAARLVMDSSVHVMMAGRGAEDFAAGMGLEMVENTYFHTEKRLAQLRKILSKEQGQLDLPVADPLLKKFGTVGCVALDKAGNLAAGTSTGGMTTTRYGRVGDSPIIGAGTYADNDACGVSCTGHGEYFIRNVVAYDVAALMLYGGKTVDEAANEIIHTKLPAQGGTGGLVAMDRNGNISMPFNTDGMFRGYVKSTGETEIAIYKD